MWHSGDDVAGNGDYNDDDDDDDDGGHVLFWALGKLFTHTHTHTCVTLSPLTRWQSAMMICRWKANWRPGGKHVADIAV